MTEWKRPGNDREPSVRVKKHVVPRFRHTITMRVYFISLPPHPHPTPTRARLTILPGNRSLRSCAPLESCRSHGRTPFAAGCVRAGGSGEPYRTRAAVDGSVYKARPYRHTPTPVTFQTHTHTHICTTCCTPP